MNREKALNSGWKCCWTEAVECNQHVRAETPWRPIVFFFTSKIFFLFSWFFCSSNVLTLTDWEVERERKNGLRDPFLFTTWLIYFFSIWKTTWRDWRSQVGGHSRLEINPTLSNEIDINTKSRDQNYVPLITEPIVRHDIVIELIVKTSTSRSTGMLNQFLTFLFPPNKWLQLERIIKPGNKSSVGPPGR